MKKIFTAAFCLAIYYLSFGQISSKEYKEQVDKALALYFAKEYKDAAVNYSLAMRNNANLVTNSDRYNVACCWARAGVYDSAFFQLGYVATSTNLDFGFLPELFIDADLLVLHNDQRWKDLKKKMFYNARPSLKAKDAGTIYIEQYKTGIGFLMINDLDSAVFYITKVIESNQLTFYDAQGIVANDFVAEVEKDKRWTDLKSKLFSTLNKKYVPASAFSKTQKSPKRMLIDGGHWNGHDISGTYATLAGTLRKNGFVVSGLDEKFDEATLKNTDILLISNPHAGRTDSLIEEAKRAKQEFRWSDAATQSAFTESEAALIENWVKNGGSFFLILDHPPNAQTGRLLTAALGIDNRFASTYDPLSRDPAVDSNRAKTILFTRSKGLIGKHPIMNGVDSVTTYTGESLIGPPGSDPLLILPSTATDLDWLSETKQFRNRSAAGRFQAIAFSYGKGRVVMLGEAALTRPEFLSVSDRGNWKFILNIFRWLAREKLD